MEAQSKRLWIVTLANIVVISVVVSLLVRAPGDWRDWLFYSLPPIGLALSVTGLMFTKGVVSRASRRVTSVVNGCALALNLVIILLAAPKFFGGTTARFLVPDGYEGDVYVVEAPDGESLNKTLWGRVVIYRIPQDGILRTQERSHEGFTWLHHYYERPDGSLEIIPNYNGWTYPGESYQERQDGSVEHIPSYKGWTYPAEFYHEGPDGSLDDRDIWLFGMGGYFTTSKGCSVPIEHFYVGTKAHLLSKYRQIDFVRYLRDHPILNVFGPSCR